MAFPAQSSKILIQSFPKPRWSPWPKAIWRKNVLFQITVHHQGKLRQNLKAGTWRQEVEKRPRKSAAYWTALCGLLRCFLIQPRATWPRVTPLPYPEEALQAHPQDQSGKGSPSIEAPLPRWSSLYHVTKANQHSCSAGGTTSSWLGNYKASVAKTGFSEFLWKKFDTQRVLCSGGITSLGCLWIWLSQTQCSSFQNLIALV